MLSLEILSSTGKRYAFIGHMVICAVKKAIPNGAVKKGDVVTAVIVRTRKEYRRKDGSYARFGDNAAVVIGTPTNAVAINTTVSNTIQVSYQSAATTTTSTFQLAAIELVKL